MTMKKITGILILAMALSLASVFPVPAAEESHEGHDHSSHEAAAGHEGSEKTEHGKMDHGKTESDGNIMHEAHVDGHHFSYELIDMREKVKDMPGMKDTHHLMVYVKDGEGKALEGAKVGYFIKGPDGAEQKKMAMGMGGGYGADINLGTAGKYSIKTKVMVGDMKIMHDFEYEVK
jgi:hypothetical protein